MIYGVLCVEWKQGSQRTLELSREDLCFILTKKMESSCMEKGQFIKFNVLFTRNEIKFKH